MNEQHLMYSVEEGVATITFNRPSKLNALTPAMLMDFFKLVALTMKKPGHYFQLMHPIASWHY